MAFRHFTLELFRNQPKLWYRYIQMFLSTRVENISTQRINYKIFLMKLHHDFSVQFWKSSKKTSLIDYTISQNITSPGPKGLCITSLIYPCMHWFRRKIWNPFVSLAFNLHSFLRINVTFYTIHFYRFEGKDYLMVHNLTDLSYSCVLNSSSCFMMGMVFSGYHSTFNFYPELYKCLIDIIYKGNELFKIDLTFQVIDQDIVDNTMNSYKYSHNTILIYRIHSNLKAFMEIFFLQVRKISQLLLKFPKYLSQNFLVFDGPGFLSRTLHITDVSRQMIKASSFQCIVQLLTKNIGHEETHNFEYTSKVLSLCKVIHLYSAKDHSHQLPFTQCYKSPIFIEIIANKNYQVNITVEDFSSKTKVFPQCTLGGLHISEQLFSKFRESMTFCRSESIHRNFYSHNSSVIVLLYWYEHYDKISTVLNISQTECRHIHIDPCFNSWTCRNYTMPCNSYLMNVTKYLNVTLLSHGNGYFLKRTEEQCIVIQVFLHSIHVYLVYLNFLHQMSITK